MARHISKEDRKKIPAEDFGDPKRRLYPVRNQGDLDSYVDMVAGRPIIREALIKIARRKGLKIPEAWVKKERPSKFTDTDQVDPNELGALAAMTEALRPDRHEAETYTSTERLREQGFQGIPPRPLDQQEHRERLERLRAAGLSW